MAMKPLIELHCLLIATMKFKVAALVKRLNMTIGT